MLKTIDGELITHVAYEIQFKKRMESIDQKDYHIIIEELNRVIDRGDVHTSSWIPGSDWRGTLYEPIWIACRKNNVEAAKFYGQILYKVIMDRPEEWYFGSYPHARGKTYFKMEHGID